MSGILVVSPLHYVSVIGAELASVAAFCIAFNHLVAKSPLTIILYIICVAISYPANGAILELAKA